MSSSADLSGACSERELTAPVDLCLPDGRLDPAAVGWARRPVHRCGLPGSWGRRKRWDFWGVTGPGWVLNLTYADVDYLGLADVWFCELSTGRTFARSAAVPFARGFHLPERAGEAAVRFASRALEVSFAEVPGGTRLCAVAPGPSGGFDAEILARRPEGHESLSVVIPWSARRFQCTTKDVARPIEGRVRWAGQEFASGPDGAGWAALDFGRGKWPYRTRWNWGAAAGMVDGPRGRQRVGLQLGGKWTVGTGMTENALCVDERLSKLSEELVWTYDTRDWLRPWTIRTPRSARVELTFTPVYDKVSRLAAGVASQAVDQCFGTYAGRIVPDDGHPIEVDGLAGWAEEASWRW